MSFVVVLVRVGFFYILDTLFYFVSALVSRLQECSLLLSNYTFRFVVLLYYRFKDFMNACVCLGVGVCAC